MRVGGRPSEFALSLGFLGTLAVGAGVAGCTRTLPQPQAGATPQTAAAPVDPLRTPPAAKGASAPSTRPALPSWARSSTPSPSVAAATPDAAVLTGRSEERRGPKPEELNRAVNEAMGRLAGCFQGGRGGSIDVKFDAEPTGKAANIRVYGASDEARTCVEQTLAGVRLPTFDGPSVAVDFPMNVTTSVTGGQRRTETVPGTTSTTTTYQPGSPPKPAGAFVNP